MERLHDACGVVGILAKENGEGIDVRRYLTLALTALQHRGQESAGMAVYDSEGKIVSRVGSQLSSQRGRLAASYRCLHDFRQRQAERRPSDRRIECGRGHIAGSLAGER